MRNVPAWLRQHVAALRVLLVLSIILGIGYPALITGIAQIPGLRSNADGSLLHRGHTVVGSAIIGQAFTNDKGEPLARYFQSRPSAAGAGYDPRASGASNLGPENVVDTLPDPHAKGDTGTLSLLSLVCSRSMAVGRFEHVDGRRPYCTAGGVGAVLSVVHRHGPGTPVIKVVSVNQECPATPFVRVYRDVPVTCARFGFDYRLGQLVLVRGPGKPWPQNPVPPDAVTASASGLDPDISLAYADLQAPRIARVRHLSLTDVHSLIAKFLTGRTLGFMGEPAVNVLELNLALDRMRR
jgi:K+-transporting ATPase ATPase C chain